MSVSDIVTLVSLVIAIVAILNEKNRVHLLLKFSWLDYFVLFTAFFFINYFTFYESFYERGLYVRSLYINSKLAFSHPQNWAYIISISVLLFILWKILWAHYPVRRGEKVMQYYKRLIEINESQLLLDLIERYHKKDIIKLIRTTKDYDPNRIWWRERFQHISLKKKLLQKLSNFWFKTFRHSWYKRQSLAISTLHGVINDPAFITFCSVQRPYLFADIIAEFKENKRQIFPRDFVNSFITELINSNNFWLRKELQESQDHDNGQPEWFRDQNKVLSSLFNDLTVAKTNEVWKGFGEAAINEIINERAKRYESKMYEECRGGLHLWDFRTMYSIQFFKILIIEALLKDFEDHLFLFYYHYITRSILKTLEKFPPEEDVKSIHFALIKEMTDNIFTWLRICNEKSNRNIFYNIIDCWGQIIVELSESNEFNDDDKSELIENLMDYYCDLSDGEHTEEYRSKIEEIFLSPITLLEEDHPYYTHIATAWDNFDKAPHSIDGDLDYFIRLKEKVIAPLKLNPNKLF